MSCLLIACEDIALQDLNMPSAGWQLLHPQNFSSWEGEA